MQTTISSFSLDDVKTLTNKRVEDLNQNNSNDTPCRTKIQDLGAPKEITKPALQTIHPNTDRTLMINLITFIENMKKGPVFLKTGCALDSWFHTVGSTDLSKIIDGWKMSCSEGLCKIWYKKGPDHKWHIEQATTVIADAEGQREEKTIKSNLFPQLVEWYGFPVQPNVVSAVNTYTMNMYTLTRVRHSQ
jgi:hypothetical protein